MAKITAIVLNVISQRKACTIYRIHIHTYKWTNIQNSET